MECRHCKKEFYVDTTKRGGHNKVYCSETCSKDSNNERVKLKLAKKRAQTLDYSWKDEKTCVICSNFFKPKTTNQKYCSAECRQKTISVDFLVQHVGELDNILPEKQKWLKYRVMVLDRDNFTCKYCGRNPRDHEGVVLHVDHKIPRNKGGNDCIDNLITSCSECNLGKSDVLLELWKNNQRQ